MFTNAHISRFDYCFHSPHVVVLSGNSSKYTRKTIVSQPHVGRDPESPPSTPRWVKVFGIIVVALVLLVIILHLTGNSLGGPGSHMMPMQPGVQQP
jgi:hypothetical protein